MKTFTREEAFDYLWSGKSAFLRDDVGDFVRDEKGAFKANPNFGKVWVYADLLVDIEIETWERLRRIERHIAKAGTTVLITMISRFGDIGIRDKNITPPSDGYSCRIAIDQLTNFRDEL